MKQRVVTIVLGFVGGMVSILAFSLFLDKPISKKIDFEKVYAAGSQAVIFVIGNTCPPGFSDYTAAEGRFILGANNGDEVTGGSEFISSGQMPSHNHLVPVDGAPGCDQASLVGNPGADECPGAATTSAGGSGAYWQPFVRLKPCIWNLD